MSEARSRRQGLLVVGRRVPRWPECHTPDWVSKQGIHLRTRAAETGLRRGRALQERPGPGCVAARERAALERLRPMSAAGSALLGEERAAVNRSMSATRHHHRFGRAVHLAPTALKADISAFPCIASRWNKWLGYFYYPITPAFYWKKADALYPIVKKVIVTELQAEPWPSLSVRSRIRRSPSNTNP